MANKSISQLNAGAAVAGTDLFPDVQVVGVGPVKVTAAQLATYFWASPSFTGNASITGNFTGYQIYNPPTTLTSDATIGWNTNLSAVATLTLNHVGATLTPSNLVAGGTYLLFITQGTGGNKTITTWTNFKFIGGAFPTLSASAGAVDIITGYSDGTFFYATPQLGFA